MTCKCILTQWGGRVTALVPYWLSSDGFVFPELVPCKVFGERYPARPPGYHHAKSAVKVCTHAESCSSSSRSTDSDVVFGGGGERPLRRRVLEGLGERWHYCHSSARRRSAAVMTIIILCRWRCGHRWRRRRTSSRAFLMTYYILILYYFPWPFFFFFYLYFVFRPVSFCCWSFATRSLGDSERSSFRLLAHSM